VVGNPWHPLSVAAGGLRIISGTLKGRRIATPDWDGLRPTSDRLRETLFNVLAPRIAGARVLDGYAGTGAVGIEALSRGAAHVTFVEQDSRALALIERNLANCGLAPGSGRLPVDRSAPVGGTPYAIIRARFAGAARSLAHQPFDIIFLDPPYGPGELAEALEAAAPLVRDGSLLVIEHAKRDAAPETVGALERSRDLVSGDSALAFYVRR
jgi:16S rRNA (guanine966-N2)-methyltransferase